MASSLAQRWKEIQGEKKWSGLLDPLDPDLRKEIIRYGEFAQAVYDGLDGITSGRFLDSKLSGHGLYGKSSLFGNVGLRDTKKYTITRYLYSTEKTGFLKLLFGETESSWMGFIAVSNDEETARLGRRDIVISCRGTIRGIEWIYNIREVAVPFPKLDGSTEGSPLVHKGFLALYNTPDSDGVTLLGSRSMRQQVVAELERLLEVHQGEEIVTGHSLGGALATLCAFDIVNNGVNRSASVAAFTFASPKVGSIEFKRQADEQVNILRIVDRRDVVPMVPPPAAVYKHPGVELRVDGSQSTYLKFTNFWELQKPHNLEGYMHTIAGFIRYVTPSSVLKYLVKPQEVKPVLVPRLSAGLTAGLTTVIGGVTTTVTETVGTVASTILLPVDKAVELLIAGDPEGLRVYNALKNLFSDDLESLQEFLINVIDITPVTFGKGEGFGLQVKRDIALVNKTDDLVKPEYDVPYFWWVLQNKGMKQDEDGTWLPRHKRPADTPSLSNPDFV